MDPQFTNQFIVQGLGGLLGGLLGVSVGAWLTGLYRVGGELTGRAAKIDDILKEVRETAKATELSKITGRADALDKILKEVEATAKATELSKITGRADALDKILKEVEATAKATEGTKIATRLEKLDQILPEVHAVTEAQKRIEANIQGGEWDRQWRLNQLRDTYARVMAALYNFQDAYRVGFDLEGNWRSPEDEDRALKYVAEFKTGCALIYIFAGTAAINAVDSYNIDIEIAQRNISFSGRRSAQQSTVAALSRLHERLIGAAREDLHVK